MTWDNETLIHTTTAINGNLVHSDALKYDKKEAKYKITISRVN